MNLQERKNTITFVSPWRQKRDAETAHTLGSFVSPQNVHSDTSSGASTAHAFACTTHGSLMIFTVNPLLALMFVTLSFKRVRAALRVMEMDITGGYAETYGLQGDRK